MKKKMLKEQYARLFKGRTSSNDAKLIKENADFEQYIDVDKMQQINRYDDRDDQNMYEDGEEIIVPLKRPIGGKKELTATVAKDGGFTSFSFEEADEDAIEAAGLDYYDLSEFMEEHMF
jgi:hypothetical protein